MGCLGDRNVLYLPLVNTLSIWNVTGGTEKLNFKFYLTWFHLNVNIHVANGYVLGRAALRGPSWYQENEKRWRLRFCTAWALWPKSTISLDRRLLRGWQRALSTSAGEQGALQGSVSHMPALLLARPPRIRRRKDLNNMTSAEKEQSELFMFLDVPSSWREHRSLVQLDKRAGSQPPINQKLLR